MNTKNNISRIDSLDYLRGLAALGVMFYHMQLYTYGEIDASNMLAKIKIYGVSIFFILSGLTLYKVHIKSFELNKTALIQFYIKRFFRIVPLLWLVTILTIIFLFNLKDLSIPKIIANITVLPGAIKPETFIARAAWSIGDEIFFYMLFPFLLWLAKYKKPVFYGVLVFSFALMCYYAFYVLNPAITLGHQWATYITPIEHLFYFAAGIALGMIKDDIKIGQWSVVAIIIIYLTIQFYPISGEPIVLVTGYTRVILSTLVILLCYLFYKTDFSFLPQFIKTILHTLGVISYSVYLTHLVFHAALGFFFPVYFKHNPAVLIGLTITLTLIGSYYTYQYFEQYFINMGKTYSSKFSLKGKS